MDKLTPLQLYKMQPAFPTGAKVNEILPLGSTGMTKLEYFTAMCLSAFAEKYADSQEISEIALRRANQALECLYNQQAFAIVPTEMDKK